MKIWRQEMYWSRYSVTGRMSVVVRHCEREEVKTELKGF